MTTKESLHSFPCLPYVTSMENLIPSYLTWVQHNYIPVDLHLSTNTAANTFCHQILLLLAFTKQITEGEEGDHMLFQVFKIVFSIQHTYFVYTLPTSSYPSALQICRRKWWNMLSKSTKGSGPQPHFKELKYNFSPRITNMLQNIERAGDHNIQPGLHRQAIFIKLI